MTAENKNYDFDAAILKNKYIAILSSVENSECRKLLNLQSHPKPEQLSNLFLSDIPFNIHEAKYRIMIVGRETRGWDKDGGPFESIEKLVDASLALHKKVFNKYIKKPGKGRTFFGFMKRVKGKCKDCAIIYSNLLCFDWNKTTVSENNEYFVDCRKLSKILLKTQIDFFKPDVIIFANGPSTAKIRREFFPPIDQGEDYQDEDKKIPNNVLWKFTSMECNDGKIPCYRIHHPSGWKNNAEAGKARTYLIDKLLPK